MFVTFITIDIISELVKFDHYRDTRAAILDPCIQGIFYNVYYLSDNLFIDDLPFILFLFSCILKCEPQGKLGIAPVCTKYLQ